MKKIKIVNASALKFDTKVKDASKGCLVDFSGCLGTFDTTIRCDFVADASPYVKHSNHYKSC